MSDVIDTFLKERIDAGDFPSAVYLVAEKGEIMLHGAVGLAVVEPERIEAEKDTIYDLASLTKVLVTSLLAVKLIERRELWLNDPVSSFISSFDVADKQSILVEDLATHMSGLPAWLPFYLLVDDPARVSTRISQEPLVFQTGSETLYSDLNFILLAAIVEEACGRSLGEMATSEIFEPLGLHDTGFNPPVEIRSRIAASEKGSNFERRMCIEKGFLGEGSPLSGHHRSALRTELIWGAVHDCNAHFMYGVGGHAGLFSTAEEVFKIAQQFLPNFTRLLDPDMCELFVEDPDLNERRSFGFQLGSSPESTAGMKMSPQSFGHLGFTGTSLWIDPVTERVFVLLTNRTHNRSLPFANLNAVRRRFHDLAIDFFDQK